MFAGLTMVSNFKYYSCKDINPRKSVSFPVVVAIALAVVGLVAVSSTLPEIMFLVCSYATRSRAMSWPCSSFARRKSAGMFASPLPLSLRHIRPLVASAGSNPFIFAT